MQSAESKAARLHLLLEERAERRDRHARRVDHLPDATRFMIANTDPNADETRFVIAVTDPNRHTERTPGSETRRRTRGGGGEGVGVERGGRGVSA